jgi:hypothetical protein
MLILICIVQFQDILYSKYFPRFLLAWIVNYQNQALAFDDAITKCPREIHASSFKSRHPHCEKPSEIFFTLWTQAVARPEHQTMRILFIFGLLTKW